MQQSDDLSPLEIVEMFAGLSCFLKDSSGVSQTLLDDFRMCQGYSFLCDLMLRYGPPLKHLLYWSRGTQPASSSVPRLEQGKEDEPKDALKDLVNLVTCLCTYGVTELKPAGLTTGAPFLLPGFVLPQPTGKGAWMRTAELKLRKSVPPSHLLFQSCCHISASHKNDTNLKLWPHNLSVVGACWPVKVWCRADSNFSDFFSFW